jgi:pimeloyl-ACP methyl ester carboxylesterase
MFHLSLNSPSKPTIILLHGLFCSHLEFAYLTPHLQDYHVLLVDLPGHSRSRAIAFHLADTVDRLAALIAQRAPAGTAHVVGVSFGGFLALELARAHPARVRSVVASGATPFRGVQRWLARHPAMLYLVLVALVKACPDWVYWWMCRRLGLKEHAALRVEMKANMTGDLLRSGYGQLLGVGMEQVGGIEGVRVAVVAGGKQDDVECVGEMGRVLGRSGQVSKAFVVREAVHGWDLQFPELFARGTRAWAENREMPVEFEVLE